VALATTIVAKATPTILQKTLTGSDAPRGNDKIFRPEPFVCAETVLS